MEKPDRIHIRHCLRLFFHQGKTQTEAKEILCNTYGAGTVSKATCSEWYKRFSNGDFNVDGERKSSSPKDSVDRDLWALVLENPSMSSEELARALGVSQVTVGRRLRAIGLFEKDGKLFQRQLDQSEMDYRATVCFSLRSIENTESFLWRIVTGGERWIMFDNSKKGRTRADVTKKTTSAVNGKIDTRKVLLCVWWDKEGVLYYELLRPEQVMNRDRFSAQLKEVENAWRRKRKKYPSHLVRVVLMQENIGKEVTDTCEQLGWEWALHPMFSPDISPSYYHLFPSMDQELSGQHFGNVAEVEQWVTSFFNTKPTTFYHEGIHILPERWQNVIDNGGGYIE